MNYNLLLICLLCLCLSAQAQQVENTSSLTVDQIMQGEKFVGYVPQSINWSEDGKFIYFRWNPDGEKLRTWYKVSREGGAPEKVTDEEVRDLPSFNGDYANNYSKKVYSKHGDVFLLDIATNKKLQITNTVERESNVRFSFDDEKIIYQRGSNIYAWSVADGTTTQLTNFQRGSASREQELAEHEEWLNNDQLTYFGILKERKEMGEMRKEMREAQTLKRPKEIYLGGKFISNIRLSSDMRFVTYRLMKRSKAKGTKVPSFVTESGYLEDITSRKKVGSPQDEYEFWVYDRVEDKAYQVDAKQIEGIYDKPAYKKEYHTGTEEYSDQYEKPRAVIMHGPVYSENGKALLDIRAMDNKDRWLMLLNPEDGKLELIERQHDDAWIGGPGISSWNFVMGNMGWLPDNETIWFQSEETGYSHLFTKNTRTKKAKALTSGEFEVLDAQLSRDKTSFLMTTNEVSPHEHHFYKMPITGGKRTQITSKTGNHEVTLSPDEQFMAVRYSFSNQPWELFVMPTKKGGKMTQLTESTTKAFQAYSWRAPDVIRFKAADGADVPARIYKPKNPNGAAVIFVHGAGYLQNVHKWWSTYYREYMFHNILADNGYTVLDIDYRASNGYGRDWRTGIYRHMGGKDLSDQVDGAKFLVEKHGIDKERIGIYGGSYGGFITLMAMFTAPETFKSGAALRSVTDWAHYNHPYTSNILNTPAEDSIAYYKSSPLYHAKGLIGNLVMLHGMIDANVQFQDVVRLSQRLIELKKENWEMAVFPMEGHGFREASSWSDEYRRIFKLFQQTLRKKE